MIGIELGKVCTIILQARALDLKDVALSEDVEASNATDDPSARVLGDEGGLASAEDLAQMIEALNVDERARLVALAWIGRGDYDADEWEEAVRLATERLEGPTGRYLAEMPLMGDYLDEGLAAFDLTCSDAVVQDGLPDDAPGIDRLQD